MKVGDRVILSYVEGDADIVEVVSMDGDGSSAFDTGSVRLPDGRIARTLLDNLSSLSDPGYDLDAATDARAPIGAAYRFVCEGDPCRRLRFDRFGQPTNLPANEIGPIDPGAGNRYHPECRPA